MKPLLNCLLIAALLQVSGANYAESGASEMRIFFVNARGKDGQNLGYKRIFASGKQWEELIKPSLKSSLEQEFGATHYTYGSVSPGKCYVFSRRVDDKEGAKLYLDYKSSLEKAKALAIDLENRAYYPRTTIEVGCNDGVPGTQNANESTFTCVDANDTVTVRSLNAASDVFSISSSSGRNGSLNLVALRRKIDRLESKLRESSSENTGFSTPALDGEASAELSETRSLASQLEQASDEYRKALSDGVLEMCPTTKLASPSQIDKADQWIRRLIEERRECSFKVPRNNPKSCEYDPVWHAEPDGIRG